MAGHMKAQAVQVAPGHIMHGARNRHIFTFPAIVQGMHKFCKLWLGGVLGWGSTSSSHLR